MISDSVGEVFHDLESLARIFAALAKTSPELASGDYVAAILAVACDEEVGSEFGVLKDPEGYVTAWSPAPGSVLYPTRLYLEELDDITDLAVVVEFDLVSGTQKTTLFTGESARRWILGSGDDLVKYADSEPAHVFPVAP